MNSYSTKRQICIAPPYSLVVLYQLLLASRQHHSWRGIGTHNEGGGGVFLPG